MTTGEKIYSLRKEARITQEEFAEKLEVSRQAVSKWESDLSYPETEKLIKITQMFGVTCDYLLNDVPRYESDLVDKRNREFLTMMVSFSIACVLVGLIVAYVCYWAISDWYSPLIGLGVFAAFLLTAFVLWSVGRYKFLSACNYSEADKSHLIKQTKILLFTVVIAVFAYLPPISFIWLEQVVDLQLTRVTVSRKLSFLSYILCMATYVPTGITVAKILSTIHDKISGKEITRLKLFDLICVALIAITLTATAFNFMAYIYDQYVNAEILSGNSYDIYVYVPTVLFVVFSLTSVILLANAIVHKKYENTTTAVFILQICCAVLLLANIICFYCTFINYENIYQYFNYAFGALLTVAAIALIMISALQAKRNNNTPLNQLRIFVPVCLFALIQLQPLIGDSVGIIIWIIMQYPVFVLPNIIKNK
ncbi:MAG: helix-turn-helix domain-containing protein [Candidatus Coproplasma sp.]